MEDAIRGILGRILSSFMLSIRILTLKMFYKRRAGPRGKVAIHAPVELNEDPSIERPKICVSARGAIAERKACRLGSSEVVHAKPLVIKTRNGRHSTVKSYEILPPLSPGKYLRLSTK